MPGTSSLHIRPELAGFTQPSKGGRGASVVSVVATSTASASSVAGVGCSAVLEPSSPLTTA